MARQVGVLLVLGMLLCWAASEEWYMPDSNLISDQEFDEYDYHSWPCDYVSWNDPEAYECEDHDHGHGPKDPDEEHEHFNWLESPIYHKPWNNKGGNFGFSDSHAKFRVWEQTLNAQDSSFPGEYPGLHNVDRIVGEYEEEE